MALKYLKSQISGAKARTHTTSAAAENSGTKVLQISGTKIVVLKYYKSQNSGAKARTHNTSGAEIRDF
jgi:hypothetical protein